MTTIPLGVLAVTLLTGGPRPDVPPQATVAGPRAGGPGASVDTTFVAPRTQPVARADDGPRFAVELRAGIGTGEYHASASAGARTAGASWRAEVSYTPLPYAAAFVGFGRARFGCEGGLCAQAPVTFTGSGMDAGVRLGWRALWMQTGVLAHRLDAEWAAADGTSTRQRADSDVGMLVAAGADVPLAAGFSIAPGVRWMRHGAAFPPGAREAVVHLVADVGVRYRLPL